MYGTMILREVPTLPSLLRVSQTSALYRAFSSQSSIVPGRPPKPSKEEADNARTIRPIKSPIHSPDPSAAEHGANSIGKFPVSSVPMWLEAKEDYSADLDFDENAFSQKISRLRVRIFAFTFASRSIY